MKTNILKLSCLMASIFALIACNGSGNAIAPEDRESFTNNIVFKVYECQEMVDYVKKNEYNTLKEAMIGVRDGRDEYWKIFSREHKDFVKQVEQMTKSKIYAFYYKKNYGFPCGYFFTAKDGSTQQINALNRPIVPPSVDKVENNFYLDPLFGRNDFDYDLLGKPNGYKIQLKDTATFSNLGISEKQKEAIIKSYENIID